MCACPACACRAFGVQPGAVAPTRGPTAQQASTQARAAPAIRLALAVPSRDRVAACLGFAGGGPGHQRGRRRLAAGRAQVRHQDPGRSPRRRERAVQQAAGQHARPAGAAHRCVVMSRLCRGDCPRVEVGGRGDRKSGEGRLAAPAAGQGRRHAVRAPCCTSSVEAGHPPAHPLSDPARRLAARPHPQTLCAS